MTKSGKLIDKIKARPNNVTFRQIEKLLISEGFVLDRIASSHHIFKRGMITFAIPVHKNKVKSVYVRRVIELVEEGK